MCSSPCGVGGAGGCGLWSPPSEAVEGGDEALQGSGRSCIAK